MTKQSRQGRRGSMPRSSDINSEASAPAASRPGMAPAVSRARSDRYGRAPACEQGDGTVASDSDMGLRQRLLDLIDRSGVPDQELSMLATDTADTIRNMHRGATPRVEFSGGGLVNAGRGNWDRIRGPGRVRGRTPGSSAPISGESSRSVSLNFFYWGESALSKSTSGGSTWKSKRSAMPSIGNGNFNSEPPPRAWRRYLQEAVTARPLVVTPRGTLKETNGEQRSNPSKRGVRGDLEAAGQDLEFPEATSRCSQEA